MNKLFIQINNSDCFQHLSLVINSIVVKSTSSGAKPPGLKSCPQPYATCITLADYLTLLCLSFLISKMRITIVLISEEILKESSELLV